MAKTKGKVVEAAKQLQQLAAAEPTAKTAAKPKVDPPLTRVNGKTKSGEASGSRDGQVPASPTFDITWANFDKVKSHFGLSDKETTDVLLKVVGPDSSGSSFWVKYQQRVKEEILEQQLASNKTLAPEVSTEDAAAPKRRRVWPLKDAEAEAVLPENQLGDPSIVEGTEFANRAFYDVEMDDMEGEEEELDDPDPLDDGVEVPATTGRDDDPDSPSPGAAAVADAAPTVVCEAPPPAEPVRVPVVTGDPAKDAKDALKDGVRAVPTAARARSGRCVQHGVKRAGDSDDEHTPPLHPKQFLAFDFASCNCSSLFFPIHGTLDFVCLSSRMFFHWLWILRSCATLVEGQRHLSRQASTLDLAAGVKDHPETDTEFLDLFLCVLLHCLFVVICFPCTCELLHF